jgi:hypothetical protein
MSDEAWRTISSRLGWFIAATFVVAMLFFALGRQFHIIVPLPDFRPDGTFVDNLLAGAAHQQDHWGEDLATSLMLAAGFVALAILGTTLRRALGRDDVGGAVMAVAFLLAGAIGAATQVLYLGATEVGTSTQYCDCDFLAEEVISRDTAHQIALNVVFWMSDVSVLLFAIGLLAFAVTAPTARWAPDGLVVYARVLAVLVVLSVIWGRVAVPILLESGGPELDFELIGGLITLVVAGVLVPIWAAWLGRSARVPAEQEAGSPEGPADENEVPIGG